jgi:predicted TIM-barrel fold metal-dependent hydrolase
LPVVTTGINYRQLRYLLPLWETCRNLYVDMSWLSVADLLPFLKMRGYLKRLLFGTNYPAYTPSAAVSMITYANVGMEEKKLVGGDNLRALMENIREI